MPKKEEDEEDNEIEEETTAYEITWKKNADGVEYVFMFELQEDDLESKSISEKVAAVLKRASAEFDLDGGKIIRIEELD